MSDTTNQTDPNAPQALPPLPEGYVEVDGVVYDADGAVMVLDEHGNWQHADGAGVEAIPSDEGIAPQIGATDLDMDGDPIVDLPLVVTVAGQPAAEQAAGVDQDNIPVGGPLDATGHVMRSTDGTMAAGAMQPITNHIMQSPNRATATVDRDNANAVRPGAVELDRDGNPLPADQQSPDGVQPVPVETHSEPAQAPIIGNAGRVNTSTSLGS